jgi:hypothetical protein
MKKSTHSSATISARKGKKPHGLDETSLSCSAEITSGDAEVQFLLSLAHRGIK